MILEISFGFNPLSASFAASRPILITKIASFSEPDRDLKFFMIFYYPFSNIIRATSEAFDG